jgi:hypothetical protein
LRCPSVTSRRRLIRRRREIDDLGDNCTRHAPQQGQGGGHLEPLVIDGGPCTWDCLLRLYMRPHSRPQSGASERASENNSGSSHLALVTLLLRIGLPAAREGHKGSGPEREEAAFAARARTINSTYICTIHVKHRSADRRRNRKAADFVLHWR